MKKGHHICAACGWRNLELPQRSSSGGASHEICPACGFEPGYTDDDQNISYEDWRQQWVAGGLKWFSSSVPRPADWNPIVNLHSLQSRKRPVIPVIRLKRAAELRSRGDVPQTDTTNGCVQDEESSDPSHTTSTAKGAGKKRSVA